MRTNIEIDDNLMDAALEFSGLKTKKATVEAALRLFVAMKAQQDLIDLAGKVEFWPGYDYKAARDAD